MPSPPTKSPPSPPPPKPTPAESETAALKARKIAILHSKIAAAEQEMQSLETRKEEIRRLVKTPSPPTLLRTHITLLHAYNEIRDIGTGLMGVIAESRGVRVGEVFEEFGVGVAD